MRFIPTDVRKKEKLTCKKPLLMVKMLLLDKNKQNKTVEYTRSINFFFKSVSTSTEKVQKEYFGLKYKRNPKY